MPTVLIFLLLVIAIVAVAAVLAFGSVSLRRRSLKQQFGSEFDRLADQDGARAAESELRERQRRHDELELRDLNDHELARYQQSWTEVQSWFIDDPGGAVAGAHELITELIGHLGYPTGDREEQLAYLSVEHARTLDRYRVASDLHLHHDRGEASIEDLRHAFVHYRALFADLLGDEPIHPDAAPTSTEPTT